MAASPSPCVVWFNKGLSNVYNALCALRQDDRPRRMRLLASHTQADIAAAAVADRFFLEPDHHIGAGYPQYVLDVCRREQVNVLWPTRQAAALAGMTETFAAIGTHVLSCASPEILALMDHKARFYDDWAARGGAQWLAVPDYRVAGDANTFMEHYATLRRAHGRVCMKPAVAMFGLGFRVLTEDSDHLARLLSGDTVRLHIDDARRLLESQPTFRDLMVMQYLEGDERSLDCLAHHGELVRCVVRRKPRRSGGAQHLERNPALVEAARQLTRTYGLHSVYNIQTRDVDGVPHLLEINTRMSGGIPYACQSGVNFPYWAVRLAIGDCRPDDVPEPQTDVWVASVTDGVRVSLVAEVAR